VFLLNPAARALRGAAARGAAPGTTEWDGAPTADAREPAFERSWLKGKSSPPPRKRSLHATASR